MKRFIAWAIVIGIITASLAWALTLENGTTYTYQKVKAKIELIKNLIPICACESTGNKNSKPVQFGKNGKALKGKVNPADTGMCQINIKIHAKELTKLGLDASKESDNITFANWLYTNEGSTPWDWSKDCWQ